MYKTATINISLYYHEIPLFLRRKAGGYVTRTPEVVKLEFKVTGHQWGRKIPRFDIEAIQALQTMPYLTLESEKEIIRNIQSIVSEETGLPITRRSGACIIPYKDSL